MIGTRRLSEDQVIGLGLADLVADDHGRKLYASEASEGKQGDCLYCVTQHEVMSERLGVGPEKQADLIGSRYRTSPRFTEQERAILALNDEVTADARRVSPETWAEVKKHWRDDQIVEILATIGAYIQVSKFGDSLGVELEPVFYGRSSVLFREEPAKSPAAARHIQHFEHVSREAVAPNA